MQMQLRTKHDTAYTWVQLFCAQSWVGSCRWVAASHPVLAPGLLIQRTIGHVSFAKKSCV